MKRYLPILALLIMLAACENHKQHSERPKLIVGLVIDQMRWDYLYRYYEKYGNDGFKRLMNEGYNCNNTMINYLPPYTGPGHACIYTGSVPAIHGIVANNWIDNYTERAYYCVDDDNVRLVNDTSGKPSYSPRNLLTTTITDELRLATNFKSRVYGIAIKDRGAILPAGHTANAAYWYNDKTGDFVTSTYYDSMYQNPKWLKAFNKKNMADSLVKLNWNLLYDSAAYTQSTGDNVPYEEPIKGESKPVFPHKLESLPKADRLTAIKAIPAGNTFTFEMAKACIEGAEGGKLGNGAASDFLCVSLSSTDYAGHQFAPNSMEMEDMFLRLDKEIASFLNYLDKSVGKGNYLMFLTADHGVSQNTMFLKDRKIPSGVFLNLTTDLNNYLKHVYKKEVKLVDTILNNQVFLNDTLLTDNPSYNKKEIKSYIRTWLMYTMPKKYRMPVSSVIDMDDIGTAAVPEPIKQMAINGYNYLRCGSLQIILNPSWYDSDRFAGTTHGSWNPYDTHIPLIWYGWNIPKGETNTVINMTDISATLAALLNIQMPNGNIGKPIVELINKMNKDSK